MVLLPLRQSELHTDDWGWLAIARHADAGLASYQQTLLFGYFYRPTAMLFWELREQLAGLSVTGQLWISLLLLASCGVLLSGWLRSTGLPSLAAALAGALLVLCPPIAGTAMWLSSHNEMLAVAFGLLALWASSQMSWWRWCLAALALFLSITSKETGYVFALAAAVQQLPQWRAGLPRWMAWAGCFVVPVLIAWLLRQSVIIPIGLELDLSVAASQFATGLQLWLAHLPSALSGWPGPASWRSVVALLILGGLGAWSLRAVAGPHRRLLGAALVLLLLPPLLMSPITSEVLGQAGAGEILVNLRFYCTSMVGLVVLLALSLSCVKPPKVGAAALLVIAAHWGVVSYGQAGRWRDETRQLSPNWAELAAQVERAEALPAEGCLIDLTCAGVSAGVAPFVDPIVKAQLPSGHPALRCVILVDGRAPYYSLLEASLCDSQPWAGTGWHVYEERGRRYADIIGELCQLALRPDDPPTVPRQTVPVCTETGHSTD
ncbi:MAG: hypothetical protein R3F15_10120 [Lysobacterales bacterium]